MTKQWVMSVVMPPILLARARNPEAVFCCDPVLGDAGRGTYVRAGVADFMRERALPAASILTPCNCRSSRSMASRLAAGIPSPGAATTLRDTPASAAFGSLRGRMA